MGQVKTRDSSTGQWLCSRISARQRLRQSTRSAILTNPLDRLFHDGKAGIMGEAQRVDDGL